MQQNNGSAAIVAVAKKEPICYSGHPPEINKFKVKTFQAEQLTHKTFWTLNHLGTIHLRRRHIFTIFDPYPPTNGIPAKYL